MAWELVGDCRTSGLDLGHQNQNPQPHQAPDDEASTALGLCGLPHSAVSGRVCWFTLRSPTAPSGPNPAAMDKLHIHLGKDILYIFSFPCD